VRFPWIQVEQDARERFPAMAAWLGLDEDCIDSKMIRAWIWGTTLGPENAPPDGICRAPNWKKRLAAEMRYCGDPEVLVEAMEACGFLEVLQDGGGRIRGMDRYRAVWEKNRRRKHPKTTDRTEPDPEPGGTGPEPDRSAAVPERQTQTQTQTEAEKPLSTPAGPDGVVSGPPQLSLVPDPEPTPPPRAPAEERVFSHWVAAGHPGSIFSKERRRAVAARLAEGFTADQLCLAVDGCHKTPFNLGENDRGAKYLDLALICRDATHVERFLENEHNPPKPKAAKGTQPNWNAEHLRDAEGNLSFL
jgi:hypothetical protein